MLNEMTNQQLIETLKAASDSEENIALKMLLIIVMERITQLDQRVRDMGWQINPDRMGQ
jgi:hypothetical protein